MAFPGVQMVKEKTVLANSLLILLYVFLHVLVFFDLMITSVLI